MNYSFKIVFFYFLSAFNIIAQQYAGTRQISLGNSDQYSPDIFSIFNNPARLINIQNPQAGIYYSPAPFEIQELSYACASYIQPTQIGILSFRFDGLWI